MPKCFDQEEHEQRAEEHLQEELQRLQDVEQEFLEFKRMIYRYWEGHIINSKTGYNFERLTELEIKIWRAVQDARPY